MCQQKGKNWGEVFAYCDTDKDGLINVLELKRGLENLCHPDDASHLVLVNFLKEFKSIFKTEEISEEKFRLFVNDPVKASSIHRIH
jgi:hypothetical protein